MNVVRHEAVRVQRTLRSRKQAAQVKQIKASILILVEATLAIVAAMPDVDRNAAEHDARAPWHVA
jgi:hypothetical protein